MGVLGRDGPRTRSGKQATIDATDVLPTARTSLLDRDRVDQLTTLRVLAVHGDLVAAVTAGRWLAQDAEARTFWAAIARTCHEVGAITGER